MTGSHKKRTATKTPPYSSPISPKPQLSRITIRHFNKNIDTSSEPHAHEYSELNRGFLIPLPQSLKVNLFFLKKQ